MSKFTYVEFHDCAGKMEGAAFLRNVVEVFPYQIHIVLTDNGMAFADLPKNRDGPSRRFPGLERDGSFGAGRRPLGSNVGNDHRSSRPEGLDRARQQDVRRGRAVNRAHRLALARPA